MVRPDQYRGVEGAHRSDHRRRLLRHADRRHQGGAERLNVQAAIPYRFRRELSPGALGVAMNIPTLITLALVLAYPIYYAAYLSFHKVSLAELRRGIFPFVGLANYQRLFSDDLFVVALKNTLVFTAFSVTLELVLAVAIALLIDRKIWTSRI